MDTKLKNALLVLSGGMDSTSMLYEYRDEIALAVTFQYGSNHNRREAECARYNCGRLGIEWMEIPLDFMGQYFESSLLSGADSIPEGNYTDQSMRSTVVPFRNGMMLAVAAATSAGTYDGIRLYAPYTELTKAQIAARGAAHGLDFAHTYSCYKGGERHCGRCGTCVERREAFLLAGLPDPTLYE